jgi:replicative DNA helicase
MQKLDLDFFENVILYKSLTDDTYLASIIDYIEPAYFKNKDIRSIFTVIKDFYLSRGTRPSNTEIKAHLITDELKASFKVAITGIKDLDKNKLSFSYYLTFEAVEKIVKRKNLLNIA